MVNLLALADYYLAVDRDLSVRILNDNVVDCNALTRDQGSCLALGVNKLGRHHQVENADLALGELKLGSGHVLGVALAAEQSLCGVERLVGFLLAVNQLGQLVGQDLLGLIQALVFPGAHLIDLLQRQEGQHPDALHDICIADVAPVLIELEGAGLVGVEPDGVAGGLTHLLALRIGQQGDGHGVGILAQLAADQLSAAQHIAPLVIAAELHIAAVVLEHIVEVVALHDHVVELKEGQALLHALLIALGAQHIVHGEARAHLCLLYTSPSPRDCS
mgnify:CR=1 FL=1